MVAFPPVVAGDDVEISATSYVAFQRCPEQSAARFRGEYGPDSRAGFAGQLAHRIFARHLQAGPIGGEAFEQACREEIGAGLNMKVSSLGLKPSELRSVIAETSALYDRFKALEFDGFAGAEVGIEVAPADGVVLKGSVDAVFEEDAGWRLVDWKTGGIDTTDAGHQLGFYALLWALDRDEPPGRVEAVSVKTGERHGHVPSSAEMVTTAAAVGAMVDTLRNAWGGGVEPKRVAGPWCRFCPVLSSCDEGAAAVKIVP